MAKKRTSTERNSEGQQVAGGVFNRKSVVESHHSSPPGSSAGRRGASPSPRNAYYLMYMSYTATCVHVHMYMCTCVHVLYRKKRILFVFGFDHVFIAAKLRFLFLFAKLSDVHVYMSYTATGSSPDSVRCSGRDQPSQGHPKKNLGILQLKLARV